jgi:hypothetical protein
MSPFSSSSGLAGLVRAARVAGRARVVSCLALLAAGCLPVLACSSDDGASSSGASGDLPDATSTGGDGGVLPVTPAPGCGRLTNPCGVGGTCDGPADCASGTCRDGTCLELSPSNGAKDGDETDVDCGGTRAPACANGKGCAVSADCTSQVCTGGSCQAPTSSDGVKNGDETGTDCGGSSGKKCPAGQGCKSNADCDKVKCDPATNKCLSASSSDGIQNGTETDEDCGGKAPTNAPACAQGKKCALDGDCAGIVRCDAGAKTCNPPSSTDGLKNGTETDVDCGGVGGTNAPKCAPTKACLVASDCVDDECTNKVCILPTNTDKKKNGNESGKDCGSSGPGTNTSAPRCDAGETCSNGNDCKSGGCNTMGVCAAARSCTVVNGGTTCGAGDNASEDCCVSDLVPAYTSAQTGEGFTNPVGEFRLDRYQITSGRIRQFLTAVNGDVKSWVVANRASVLAPEQLPLAQDPFLPAGWTQPNSTDKCYPQGTAPTDPVNDCNYGALNQVSGYRYTNEPGGDGGYGCYMSDGGYGARTFWLSAAESANTGEIQHLVSRARVERKAMVCTTYYIYAAFCAWDGGRLETFDEYNAAYGGNGSAGRAYPWSSASIVNITTDPLSAATFAGRAIGFGDLFDSRVAPIDSYGYVPASWIFDGIEQRYSVFNPNITAQQRADLRVRVNRANLRWNYYNAQIRDYRSGLENRANAPINAEANIDVSKDQSVAVAPPGRYPDGAGKYGHRDLLGNTIEMTATGTTSRRWARNGSFETAHFAAANMTGVNGYSFSRLAKYGRAGARCARPVSGYLANPLP